MKELLERFFVVTAYGVFFFICVGIWIALGFATVQIILEVLK